MQSFMKKCQEISFKVLSCFALGLGFDEDFFTKVRSCLALSFLSCYIRPCRSEQWSIHINIHAKCWTSDLQAKALPAQGLDSSREGVLYLSFCMIWCRTMTFSGLTLSKPSA